MTTRQQGFACRAYDCIETQKKESSFPDYKSAAFSLPTFILQNGLVQATGFLLAKGRTDLLEDLAKTLDFKPKPDADKSKSEAEAEKHLGEALHLAIVNSDTRHYQMLTRNSLEAAAWLRRYLQALPEDKAQQTDEEASA